MKLNFQEEHPYILSLSNAPPYPLVPVTLTGRRGLYVATYALLDTGADVSMFQSRWAEKIGIDLEAGREEHINGIKGGILCFAHNITIKIGAIPVQCEVLFSRELGDNPEDQLVGREGVFDGMRFAFRQSIQKFYIGQPP